MNEINITQQEQVENTVSIERDISKVAAKITYEDKLNGWESRCPQVGTPHPRYGAILRVKRVNSSRLAGGMVRVELSYEPIGNTNFEFGGGDEVEESIESCCQSEPLLTHPKFKNLDDEEKTALRALMNGCTQWEEIPYGSKDTKKVISEMIKSPNAKLAMGLIQKGVESYLCPSNIYTKTSTISSLSLSGVGKIDNPSGAPNVGNGYDWLKDSLRGDRVGRGNWRQVECWRLSGSGGWEKDLY